MLIILFIALLGAGGLFSSVIYYSRVKDKQSLQGWRETSWIASLAAFIPFLMGLRFFMQWGTMVLAYFLLSCLFIIPLGITLYADRLQQAILNEEEKKEDSNPTKFP